MFTVIGHRPAFLLILALICIGLPGCGRKKGSSQSKPSGKTQAAPKTVTTRDILKEPKESDVTKLVAMLSDKNHETRQEAAAALWLLKSDTSSSVSDLTKLLDDESTEVRTSATRALASIGGETAVASLSKAAIKEKNAAARTEMWTSIGLLGATSALTSGEMTSADRSSVLAGLKKRGDEESVSAVIDQWLSSDSSEVRQSGLAHLAQSSAAAGHVARVVELLRDEHETVRRLAAETLKSVKLDSDMQAGSLVNRFLTAANAEERQSIRQELCESDQDTSSALLKLITGPNVPADVRTSALGLLSGQDSEVLAKNLDQLQAVKFSRGTDKATSNLLTSTLLRAGGKPSQESLLHVAVSPQIDPEVRCQALGLLEPSDGSEVATELAAALQQVGTIESSVESQHALTISLLSAIRIQGANAALTGADIAEVVRDRNTELHQAALAALLAVNRSAPETTSALKSALTAGDQVLRDQGMTALRSADVSQLRQLEPQLEPQLAQRLNDGSDEEQKVVLGLLQKAGPKALSTAASEIADSLANARTSEERKTLLGLMAHMQLSELDASKSLAAVLGDGDPEVSGRAMKLLSKASPQQIANVAPELAATIEFGTAQHNQQVLNLLKQAGPDAIDAATASILKALKETPPAIDRNQVLKILAIVDNAPDAFAETLTDMAGSDDRGTQKEALALLRKLSPASLKSVAPKLSKQLANSNGDQMTGLLDLLDKAGSDSVDAAAMELSRKLKQSTDSADKQRLLDLLSIMELPPERQLESAMAALSAEDEQVRATAPALDAVRRASKSKDSAIRKLALDTLIASRDSSPATIKSLQQIDDPELTVKASELVTSIRKTIAESTPSVSAIEEMVEENRICDRAEENARCAGNGCHRPKPSLSTSCCPPIACQPVCVRPKKLKTCYLRVQVKTVSYRKHTKMQARMTKRNRR